MRTSTRFATAGRGTSPFNPSRDARPAIPDWGVNSLIIPLELPGLSSFATQEGPLDAG
jgi:hypothetical protein